MSCQNVSTFLSLSSSLASFRSASLFIIRCVLYEMRYNVMDHNIAGAVVNDISRLMDRQTSTLPTELKQI